MKDLTIVKVYTQAGKQIGYSVKRADGYVISCNKAQILSSRQTGHEFTNATISDAGKIRVDASVPREALDSCYSDHNFGSYSRTQQNLNDMLDGKYRIPPDCYGVSAIYEISLSRSVKARFYAISKCSPDGRLLPISEFGIPFFNGYDRQMEGDFLPPLIDENNLVGIVKNKYGVNKHRKIYGVLSIKPLKLDPNIPVIELVPQS